MSENIQFYVVFVLLGIFSVIGTLGNTLVLYIYSKKRDITTSSLFILTLAGTDFFTCLVIIPFNMIVLKLNYILMYDFPCKLYMFLITCNVPFSAFVMVAIAFDRYFCICHPFLHVITIPRAKIIVFVMGIIACSFGVITALSCGIFPGPDAVNVTEMLSLNNTVTTSYLNYNQQTTLMDNVTSVVMATQNSSDGSASAQMDIMPGQCVEGVSGLIEGDFVYIYQKIYALFYLIAFLIVLILYGLIYRSIHIRRALKAKRKRSSLYPHEFSAVDTQMTVLNNGHPIDGKDNQGQKKFRKKALGLKEKVFYANIRTAAMLFIVTVVFLIAFLPAWLMAHLLVPYNMIVFYMYFIYNVGNPIIYAFMNTSFRDDLQGLLKRVCNRK